MNEILLKGQIKDIAVSHSIGQVEFSRARLLVPRRNGAEDVIELKFKTYSNRYKENDVVTLRGNVRSYSTRNGDKNKVQIYVFTYFDEPELSEDTEVLNTVKLSGRICKMNELRLTQNKRHNVHFILANNLDLQDTGKKLNSYIPCIAWGALARELAQLPVNTKLQLEGELHSREHTKVHADGEMEIRLAHEFTITSYKIEE